MAVAVALGPALGAGLTVLGAAHRVGIGRQQGVDHGLQQTAHQVRGGLSQSLVKGSSRVDNMSSGHRDDVLSRIRWKVDSKDHTVTAPTTNTRASHRRLHHTTGHYHLECMLMDSRKCRDDDGPVSRDGFHVKPAGS